MMQPQRIVVSFAGSAVAIELADVRIAEIVDFLIHPALIDNTKEPHCTLRALVTEEEQPVFTLYLDNEQKYHGTSMGSLAEVLQSMVCHELADTSRDGLLLHAAALADAGRGVLIPGGIGAGKSTLTGWLLSKGLGYMTDELVYVPWGSNDLVPYPRPLHLKYPSRSVLAAENLNYEQSKVLMSSSFSDMVAVEAFTPQQITQAMPFKLALFPAYRPQGAVIWQPLTPAQIGQHLMGALVNARNLPDHGFHEVARLARLAEGYAFQYNHFNQIEEPLAGVLTFKRE
jgi:hypothetical protein